MKIVIVGAGGQLGKALTQQLPNAIALKHHDVELTDAASLTKMWTEHEPECVINTAAYNLVDQAESEPEAAYAVNALGPRLLAERAAEHGTKLVHISSDYVFGLDHKRNIPFTENDAPGPESAYGISKLAGEYFVRATCPQHFVLRTCGLYGATPQRHRGNFVETMLRLGQTHGLVRVVNDQQCTPTSTIDLATAIIKLIETDQYGLYHATNTGSMTWYEFACEIFRQEEMDVEVTPITTAEFNAKAPRPGYSVLDCSRLQRVLGWQMNSWQEALSEYLAKRDTFWSGDSEPQP